MGGEVKLVRDDLINRKERKQKMKRTKQLTAQDMFDWLKELKRDGVNLSKVDVNYRFDSDSDVEEVCSIEEDLRDPSDNDTLISICLFTKPDED
jgi:hypothetical protein